MQSFASEIKWSKSKNNVQNSMQFITFLESYVLIIFFYEGKKSQHISGEMVPFLKFSQHEMFPIE